MEQGASIRISPSWIAETVILDIQWDTDNLSDPIPIGKWWGDLALFAGTGSNEGEWEWDPSTKALTLWVPQPGLHRILVAHSDQFDLPAMSGAQGSGRLATGLAPTTEPPTFVWEIP